MDWKTVKLGEVCTIKGRIGFRGYTIEDFVACPQDGAITLSPTNIVNGEIDFSDCKYVNWEKYNESPEIMISKGDIVIVKTGSSIGRTAYFREVPHEITINPQFVVLKDCLIDSEFLSYLVKTQQFQGILQSIVVGSAIPTLSQKNLGNLSIRIPVSHADQRRIASILSSLDLQIDNNKRINNNLEEQARTLFKSWFVDFEPFANDNFIDSEIGEIPASLALDTIANIPHSLETGRRPKGGVGEIKEGVPSVGAEHVKGLGAYDFGKTKYIPFDFAQKVKSGIVKGYELLIYKDGGKPGYFIPNFSIFGEGYPFDHCILNEHVFKLDFEGNRAYNAFAYFYFHTDYVMNYLNAEGGKAAIPGINQQAVNSLWIFTPDNPKVKEFGDIVLPMITKILHNLSENKRLADLRDTLLPKLMKGEIEL